MHELALAHQVARIVTRAAAGRPVERVRLEVGRLRQVVPGTLEYCWGFVTDATSLAGSTLAIDHLPVRLACRACGSEGPPVEAIDLSCAACGSRDVAVVTGEEFRVTSLDLITPPDAWASADEGTFHGALPPPR